MNSSAVKLTEIKNLTLMYQFNCFSTTFQMFLFRVKPIFLRSKCKLLKLLENSRLFELKIARKFQIDGGPTVNNRKFNAIPIIHGSHPLHLKPLTKIVIQKSFDSSFRLARWYILNECNIHDAKNLVQSRSSIQSVIESIFCSVKIAQLYYF